MFKVAPLKSSFMVISIIGFFVSILMVWPASPSFGLAFAIVFAVMFIASLISMTYAPIEEAEPIDLTRKFETEHVGGKKPSLAKKPAKKKVVKKKAAKKKASKKSAAKKSSRKPAKKASKKRK